MSAVRERPIPFNAPMVRALLAGTKTQTRRVVKPQPAGKFLGMLERPIRSDREPAVLRAWFGGGTAGPTAEFTCPYGKPGDRLWVREAWRVDASLDRFNGTQIADRAIDAGYPKPWAPIQYEADGARDNWVHKFSGVDTAPGRLRLARFMPRWASRITLEVTGVRVERLQTVSRGDAMAEGCPFANMAAGPDPRAWYADLWNAINGAGAWDANPWVWVVEFRRLP